MVSWYGLRAISQVSDCVRILAVSKLGGWVVDTDNVWLRPPPPGDFHFATLASMRTSARSVKTCWGEQRDRHWDGIGYLGTPFTFPKGSEFSADVQGIVNRFMDEYTSVR